MALKAVQESLSRPLRWWRGLRGNSQVRPENPGSVAPIPDDWSLKGQPGGQSGDAGWVSSSHRDPRQESKGDDAGLEPPRVASHQRIYAIGDIHGRHDLLVKLLSQIDRDAKERTDGRDVKLVFLGDYIDRGDESAKVLDFLLSLSLDRSQDVSFLEGNHEAAMVDFLADPVRGRAWLDHGGRQTLASYGIRPPDAAAKEAQFLQARDNFKEALGGHLKFLERLQLMETSGAVLFVHAGLNPTLQHPKTDREALLWGHPACMTANPLPGRRIVHGHFEMSAPLSLPGRICIDTGAYHSGQLTAVRLDDQEGFLTTTA
jgi:serine/threonine protein phosphatase 1